MSNTHLTIAIDGPVASGKTAVGKEVSKILKIRFLDTGIMYRALCVAAIKEAIDPTDEIELCKSAKTILVDFDDSSNLAKSIKINGYDVTASLRNSEVNRLVSTISKIPEIRKILVTNQRELSKHHSIIMVGRDIGTNVLKNASTKFYLEASVPIRAQRRFAELNSSSNITLDQVLEDIKHRDSLDSTRSHAPLKKASDAILINTDDLNIDQTVSIILKSIKCR